MELHRVLIDRDVHVYVPNQRWTLCGIDKRNRPRVNDATDCTECIDAARSRAIRNADRECGLDGYPEFQVVAS